MEGRKKAGARHSSWPLLQLSSGEEDEDSKMGEGETSTGKADGSGPQRSESGLDSQVPTSAIYITVPL